MMDKHPLPGSFRDPKGRVYVHDNCIFRTVTDQGFPDFKFVRGTGLLDELVADGLLVSWREASKIDFGPDALGARLVLEHEKLPFISYPYEWSFSALKAAALLHLDIQLRALAKDVTLSDASAYNVQFDGPKPVFIDHLSFQKYEEGAYWQGHRQFCNQFLNPLLLASCLEIPHNAYFRGTLEGITSVDLASMLPWYYRFLPTIFSHVFLSARFERAGKKIDPEKVSQAITNRKLPRKSFEGMLLGLRDFISNLKLKKGTETVWSSYVNSHNYSSDELEKKKSFVIDFVQSVKPETVWDLGTNVGDFSAIALSNGTKRSIGFEADTGALELAFNRAVAENLNFLPLFSDIANPSPDQGWQQSERTGLVGRKNADAIFALALIHHLCIGRNIPLADAIKWLMALAPQGIIEFVPKSDPMVQELLRFREDIFRDYDETLFQHVIESNARLVRKEKITESARQLVWYDRS